MIIKKIWPIGLLITIISSLTLLYHLEKGDRLFFLAGETTHGHYQIELVCSACHSEPFAGKEAIQQTCESCHQSELDKVSDSHPKKKFSDPRFASMLNQLDATQCVSCHKEHDQKHTYTNGVTLPIGFCETCHQETLEERPSHQSFDFTTCAYSGCHNYHDNSMLYEDYLARSLNKEPTDRESRLPLKTAMSRWTKKNPNTIPLSFDSKLIKNLYPDELINQVSSQDLVRIISEWQQSSHAITQVACIDCHQNSQNTESNKVSEFLKVSKPEISACNNCHEKQVGQYLESRHGMSLALGLKPLKTEHSRLNLKPNQETGCIQCHNPHALIERTTQVEACLNCHNDEHSLNYKLSPHFVIKTQNQEPIVTCSNCHLPRIKKGKRIEIGHNPNDFLRPNSKILRPVCDTCHSTEFSLAALSDTQQVKANFSLPQENHHPTYDLVRKRDSSSSKDKESTIP